MPRVGNCLIYDTRGRILEFLEQKSAIKRIRELGLEHRKSENSSQCRSEERRVGKECVP